MGKSKESFNEIVSFFFIEINSLISERAKQARLFRCTECKFAIYMYTYIFGGTYIPLLLAQAPYDVKGAELGHSHFYSGKHAECGRS